MDPTYVRFDGVDDYPQGEKSETARYLYDPKNLTNVDGSSVADDTTIWFDELFVPRMFKDLKPKDIVYHETCEGREGTPSAVCTL
jgi:hypothetical protein